MIASPSVQPVKCEKLRTHLLRVTTLKQTVRTGEGDHTRTRHVPAGERVRALQVQLVALLHEPLPVPQLVHAVVQVRVQDFHRCPCVRVVPQLTRTTCLPLVIRMHPSGYDEYASYRVASATVPRNNSELPLTLT